MPPRRKPKTTRASAVPPSQREVSPKTIPHDDDLERDLPSIEETEPTSPIDFKSTIYAALDKGKGKGKEVPEHEQTVSQTHLDSERPTRWNGIISPRSEKFYNGRYAWGIEGFIDESGVYRPWGDTPDTRPPTPAISRLSSSEEDEDEENEEGEEDGEEEGEEDGEEEGEEEDELDKPGLPVKPSLASKGQSRRKIEVKQPTLSRSYIGFTQYFRKYQKILPKPHPTDGQETSKLQSSKGATESQDIIAVSQGDDDRIISLLKAPTIAPSATAEVCPHIQQQLQEEIMVGLSPIQPTDSSTAQVPASMDTYSAEPVRLGPLPFTPLKRAPITDDPSHSPLANVTETLKEQQLGANEDSPALEPQCQRCRSMKKGCNRERPCQNCLKSGIGIDGCISDNEDSGQKPKTKQSTPVVPNPIGKMFSQSAQLIRKEAKEAKEAAQSASIVLKGMPQTQAGTKGSAKARASGTEPTQTFGPGSGSSVLTTDPMSENPTTPTGEEPSSHSPIGRRDNPLQGRAIENVVEMEDALEPEDNPSSSKRKDRSPTEEADKENQPKKKAKEGDKEKKDGGDESDEDPMVEGDEDEEMEDVDDEEAKKDKKGKGRQDSIQEARRSSRNTGASRQSRGEKNAGSPPSRRSVRQFEMQSKMMSRS